MKTPLSRLATFALCCCPILTAQRIDDGQLKQVIIFGRHSVRTPVTGYSQLDTFAVRKYPEYFSSTPGVLTDNGRALEKNLGGYYRLWLTKEGLLTGNDVTDANFVYFRANVLERTIDTAVAFAAGLLPAATVTVNHYGSGESDPLFDPIGAGVAEISDRTAVASVVGRLGSNHPSVASAFASELALTRSVLLDYPNGQTPPPLAPSGTTDVTALPITVSRGTLALVDLGGLSQVVDAIDPFVMQYAEGLPPADVGWGQLTVDQIGEISRLYILSLDLEERTPYLDKVQSSNVVSHVVRSMLQFATGNAMTGALGNPSTKLITLIASDTELTGFAGLFQLDWLLPTYQQDYCAPGGALVLELRQSQRTAEFFIRASYIVQTMDQLHNQTPLSLTTTPAIAPLFIPGCSINNATFDCPLTEFVKVAKRAVDPQAVSLTD
jgi:4-phytase / acid phosphatase